MACSYLLLGSNQGDREYFLTEATQGISLLAGEVIKKSAVYETAAWGLEDQAAFLNQVVQISTPLLPADLLTQINKIEKELGRVREVKWAARVIDIDILYYNDLILQTENLVIPHPHLHERRFTIVPLAELTPDFVHPVLQQTNKDLLATCKDRLEVRVFKK
ncbi:MAG: 2-amino-4-hydroxy-6-hydroxymethyldihydropteridine diphosphokinase [Cytophagales bacterium CG18_big_fil_WC_8_21_14_2_50_42_9]|nr:MAG: 2-amino-4-hydroxy-6-hydroxymethyldihydropteridine diphosphokinase [Cytophagales bacterium CG18_big_fil_WC_8_21_14_2_50_42_9]